MTSADLTILVEIMIQSVEDTLVSIGGVLGTNAGGSFAWSTSNEVFEIDSVEADFLECLEYAGMNSSNLDDVVTAILYDDASADYWLSLWNNKVAYPVESITTLITKLGEHI